MNISLKIFAYRTFLILCLVSVFYTLYARSPDPLRGAWNSASGNIREVLLFQDGYFTHSRFDISGKIFLMSRGGPYTMDEDKLSVVYEFDSAQPEETGSRHVYAISVVGDKLDINLGSRSQRWTRGDDSSAPLAGVWKISERAQNGELVQIHQQGTRKTLKILTGTRFQWFAIDPGTRLFAGTGGGTYTFADGKYTENIEFFSRDSSRVGTRLIFDGKLQDGKWHHSGTGSRGDPIYEVWRKAYPSER